MVPINNAENGIQLIQQKKNGIKQIWREKEEQPIRQKIGIQPRECGKIGIQPRDKTNTAGKKEQPIQGRKLGSNQESAGKLVSNQSRGKMVPTKAVGMGNT